MVEKHAGFWWRIGRAGWNLLPLMVAISGWFVTLFLCRVMLTRERAQIVQNSSLTARSIQNKVSASISSHVAPLEVLVTRWAADPDPWAPDWQGDAVRFREKHPEFESVSWVDAGYISRWTIPAEADAAPATRGPIERARRLRHAVLAGAGGPGAPDTALRVFIPIFHKAGFQGCVVAVLRTDPWLRAAVDNELPRGYGAAISDRNEQLYVRNLGFTSESAPYHSEAAVKIYDSPWVVRVWPTRDEWTGSSEMLAALTLFIGLLLYIGGALAISARRKARQVEWATQEMSSQQDKLSHANERLETVVQASPFAIVAMDTQGRVERWNNASERIFGWQRDEVEGRLPLFIPEEEMAEFREQIERTSRGESLNGLERRRQKKDGTLIDVAIWTAPLHDAAGFTCGIITAMADISEQKKLQEQLRNSQKMEAVGRLAGGVAHDFNNLLTIINGYGHMMIKSLPPSDALRSHAEQIVKAGNQAASLTAQLLAFSRRQMIQPKPVDLNHVITDVEKLLRRVIGEDIVFRTVLSPALQRVKADPHQMGQVLINLAANARDAMPHGGTLTISTENATLTEVQGLDLGEIPAGSYVKLTVSDTGAGMDAETRSHLFEPFFTTKERGKGTGLGLSSVYGSVQQNGGGISVWSEEGKGAAFSIYLAQLQEPVQVEESATVRSRISRGNETILLVEDEVPLRSMLREALAAAGYRVIEAGDGAEALRQWERNTRSIDLVLTDVVMPLMNGRELAKLIETRSPDLPVIYMSGYADDVVAYHGILEAKTHFIQKPFRPDALLLKLRAVLDERARARDGAFRRATAS